MSAVMGAICLVGSDLYGRIGIMLAQSQVVTVPNGVPSGSQQSHTREDHFHMQQDRQIEFAHFSNCFSLLIPLIVLIGVNFIPCFDSYQSSTTALYLETLYKLQKVVSELALHCQSITEMDAQK